MTATSRLSLNRRALLILATAVGLAVPAGLGFLYLQRRRVRVEALATAQALADDGHAIDAIRNLDQFLRGRPNDAEAVALMARLAGDAALESDQLDRLQGAIAYQTRLLRLAPEGPEAQDTRRRLIRISLRVGDLLQYTTVGRAAPELLAQGSFYPVALQVADDLLVREVAEAARDRRKVDPAVIRLKAMALQGNLPPGGAEGPRDEADRDESGQSRSRRADVKAAYQTALFGDVTVKVHRPDPRNPKNKFYYLPIDCDGDPADVEAARGLAVLLIGQKDIEGAGRILDQLLEKAPKSAEVRLVRYGYFAKQGRAREAAAELAEAVALDPDNMVIRLVSAGDAVRRGDYDTARRLIRDELPESARDDHRVRVLDGLIEFAEEHPEEALDAWREALISSAGTNSDLTWWLAYAQLQMGRVPEAGPLIDQFRRLAGDAGEPLFRLLDAERLRRTGRPAVALDTLGRADIRQFSPEYAVKYRVIRGRIHEALGSDREAETEYRRAAELDPNVLEPRIALAALLEKSRPEEAAREMERALEADPDEAAYRIALARARLREQARRRPAGRDFRAFDEAWEGARQRAPRSVGLLGLRAEALALRGDLPGAVALLGEAVEEVLGPGRDPQVNLARRGDALVLSYTEGLRRLGRDREALDVLERAARPDAFGDRASLRIARASTLVGLRRGGEARALLARDLGPLSAADRSRVREALARLLKDQGDAVAARDAYVAWARSLDDDDPRPALALIDLALAQGDDAAARDVVEAAWRRDPASPRGDEPFAASPRAGDPNDKVTSGPLALPWRLAAAHLILREVEAAGPAKGGAPRGPRDARLLQAERHIRGALIDAPDLPAARILRARLAELRGDDRDAIDSYRLAIANGGEALALPRLIDFLARRGRFDEIDGLRRDTADARVARLAAEAAALLGDHDRAARFAAAAVEDDTAPELARWRARVEERAGRPGGSAAALRQAAEARPDDLATWLHLLHALDVAGRADEVPAVIALATQSVRADRPDLLEARLLWAGGDREAADRAFRAALDRTPDDPEVLGYVALFAEEGGDTARAADALGRVVARDPGRRDARRQLAALLAPPLPPGRFVPADRWAQAWEALGPEGEGPEDAEGRLARALLRARAPDPARRAGAEPALKALLADLPGGDPVAVAARKALARLLLAEKRPAEAREAAAPLTDREGDPVALALAAEAFLADGKADEAERRLDRLDAVAPGDDEARLRARALADRAGGPSAGFVDAVTGRFDERLKAGGPDLALPLARAAFLLARDAAPPALDAAAALARHVEAAAPEAPAARWMAATLLARAGRADEALALCAEAAPAARGFDLLEAARLAGEIATAADAPAGALDRAEALIEAARTRLPGETDLALMAALLRHRRGRYTEEVALYREVLDRHPDPQANLAARNNLAWALSEGLDRPSEGLEVIEDLLRHQGRNPAAVDTRGVILSRLGRLDEAIRDLEEAARGLPSGPVYFHLARAYRKAGREADARRLRDLEAVKALRPADLDPTELKDFEAFRDAP